MAPCLALFFLTVGQHFIKTKTRLPRLARDSNEANILSVQTTETSAPRQVSTFNKVEERLSTSYIPRQL